MSLELELLNLGTTAGDKTGDGARTGGGKINRNFEKLKAFLETPDAILVQTGYALVGQNLTFNSGWKWRIATVEYTNPANVVVNFPLAAAGKSRLDVVVLTTSNTFLRVAGAESTSTPVAPSAPSGSLYVTVVLVTDGAVNELEIPEVNGSFVLKAEQYANIINGGGGGTFTVDSEKGYFEISNYSTNIVNIEDQQGYIYLGREITFRNTGTENLTFQHNPTASENNKKFFTFPSGQDFVLKPKEIMTLKYGLNNRLNYVGASDPRKQDLLVSGVNIKTINGINILGSGNIVISGGGTTNATWGTIAGTLADQTDLITALNGKANLAGANFTGSIFANNLSGTNTGDNAPNSLYSGLVSNANHTGDASGSAVLTLATVNSNVGSFGTASNVPNLTVNAKGLVTGVVNTPIAITQSQVANLTNDLANKQNAITGLTTNFLPKWNGSGFVNSQIFDNGTNVSIGNPQISNQRLNVEGSLVSIDSKHQYLRMGMEGDVAVITTDWFSGAGGSARPMEFKTGGVTRLVIDQVGNITANNHIVASPATTANQVATFGQVVPNTTNSTIDGVKVFSSSPIVPTATLATQAVNLGQVQAISSSDTYTPTYGIGTNTDNGVPTRAIYTRLGNSVTVTGSIDVNVTTANANSFFSFNLPINRTNSTQIYVGNAGVYKPNGLSVGNAYIYVSASNSLVGFNFTPSQNGNVKLVYSYTYLTTD